MTVPRFDMPPVEERIEPIDAREKRLRALTENKTKTKRGRPPKSLRPRIQLVGVDPPPTPEGVTHETSIADEPVADDDDDGL